MEIVLIIWLAFGIAGAVVLTNKGRSGCGGFALGFLLGPIGLVIALVMNRDHRELEKQALQSGANRKCPQCAELIKVEARKCRYCGTELSPVEAITQANSIDPRDY
ncbi:zinc ribbon domain-containing protein [Novosphingobium sp. KCTC 2891]|uniref:zinc ribbon domain-containing protein n=1 Tax=Novosphingobium sp. KCTC 2891 TaxID=2989730 RepID=UPI002222087A|nr:zinc ribbon domain-containing protein [Novosphingobium sp. KCTC 2891]MCW1381511.1 zinc ribbon domain-containing protein [Novosphingobium sp. KCTC 2891]